MTSKIRISLLAVSLAASLSAADFMPLQAGNYWVYRDATTGQTFDVRVGTPVLQGGKVYYALRGFLPQQQLVRVNEYNNLVYLDEENGVEPVIAGFSPSRTTYSTNGRQCPAWGNTLDQRADYEGPAGRWSALEVQYQVYACADAGEQSEQFVENVGMVRRVENTIAGPRTFDLVYARVGKQTISAGENGVFRVTAVPGRDGVSWDVTLRVEPFYGSGLPLTFPSGQEYDLRLRDARGNILWTWSANKLFVAAVHTVTNIGGWSATTNVPHPAASPEGIPNYVLEAWLTNLPSEPQFAAATPLDVIAPAARPDARASRSRR